jgi:antitoxin CptB
MSSENLENKKKKILYQSWYRGCKETDKILGIFARKYVAGMNEDQLNLFQKILDEQDVDLFDWMSGKKPTPQDVQDNVIYQQIMEFIFNNPLSLQNSLETAN